MNHMPFLNDMLARQGHMMCNTNPPFISIISRVNAGSKQWRRGENHRQLRIKLQWSEPLPLTGQNTPKLLIYMPLY